jgi:HEAT repeat protein
VPGPEGDYLRKIHRDIHFRWAHRFIASVEARPAKDPINNPALAAEVYFTIRWDGSPAEVTLGTSSGNKELDRAAVAAVRGEGTKFAVPPVALYGDDGVVHLRWTLARDHRRCSDGELRRVEDPLDVALPRLFIQGRYKEALLRVNRYMERGDTGAMAVFARTWLARPLTNRVADLDAAAALARIGDRRQLERLRPGLASADTVVVAARGLAALKVDLCAELDPALRARGPQADVAMTALREAGAAAPGAPCLATLTAIVDDEAAPKPLRAKALRTLASLDYASARKRTIELLADPSPVLRAAAATAFARPGGGRPSLYRLEPMLKDGNVEVRAAVAGALVRASGELSFDYLQALFKSPDNRPLLAMIPALGELSSPASADLLAKILKRGPEVQEPVLRALAVRTDEKAVAAFKPLAASAKRSSRTSNDLRLFLYATSPVDEVMPLAKDPHLGILAYKAMLRAKRHKEAAEWLVGRFDHLSPEVLSDALGAWLAEPPKPFASAH